MSITRADLEELDELKRIALLNYVKREQEQLNALMGGARCVGGAHCPECGEQPKSHDGHFVREDKPVSWPNRPAYLDSSKFEIKEGQPGYERQQAEYERKWKAERRRKGYIAY